MTMAQPSGAMRTLDKGDYVDARFSSDGRKLYAVVGNAVRVFDTASGAVLATYTPGGPLGGMDLSPDGGRLAVVDLQKGGDPAGQIVHIIDLATGVSTDYDFSALGGFGTSFADVSFLANGKLLLSQGQAYTQYTLFTLDPADGTFTFLNANRISNQALVASADRSRVLIDPISFYDAGTGRVTTYGVYDPYAGASLPVERRGVEAYSPAGDIFVQGLEVSSASGTPLLSLGRLYPEFGNIDGVTFSADGSKLYLLDENSAHVFVLRTSDWGMIGGYPVGAGLFNPYSTSSFPSTYGGSLQVSADGRYVSVTAHDALQIIDLSKAVIDTGTGGDDVLSGSRYIYGFGGNDDLTADPGSAGVFLLGGAGNDVFHLDGPYQNVSDDPNDAGHDIVYSSAYAILGAGIEDLVLTGLAQGGFGNDLANVMTGNDVDNSLDGGGGADTLIGNGGNDMLTGGGGDDILRGGPGDDGYYVDSAGDQVIEEASGGTDTVYADGISWTLGDNVENLVLRFGETNGTGNQLANAITGNGDDNILTGGGAADVLAGGGGNDVLFGDDSTSDQASAGGDDQLYGGSGNDLLIGDGGNDLLSGGDGNDILFNGIATTVMINGTSTFAWSPTQSDPGNDVFDGGSGEDQAFLVDYARTAAITLDNSDPTTVNTIFAGGVAAGSITGVEHLRFFGGSGDDVVTGGAAADVFYGGAGADRLTGGQGADIFGGSYAELNGDTITDLAAGDRILVGGSAYSSFSYVRTGTALNLNSQAAITLSDNPVGRLVTSGTSDGPASLSLTNRMTGLGDFDGNGHSDILWREAGGTFSTWGVSGNAQGNQFAVNSTFVTSVDPTWRIQETFDWNGDGRSDILWRKGDSGEFSIWTGTGSGYGVNAYSQAGVGTNWQVAGLGDLNGDGKDDIVWREGNGAFSTWQSTGTGFNVNVDFDTSVSPDWQIVGLGDFDGDGRDDLLWRNRNDGTFSTWTSDGTGFTPNTNFVSSVDTTWHIDGIADFNGDGRDDILWRHDGDGAFSVWQANASGGFTPNTYLDTSVAPVWQVQTTGDYNDDGKADILWRNTASGDFSTWQSNGNGFDPNTAYVSGVDTNWQVQGHSFQFG